MDIHGNYMIYNEFFVWQFTQLENIGDLAIIIALMKTILTVYLGKNLKKLTITSANNRRRHHILVKRLFRNT